MKENQKEHCNCSEEYLILSASYCSLREWVVKHKNRTAEEYYEYRGRGVGVTHTKPVEIWRKKCRKKKPKKTGKKG